MRLIVKPSYKEMSIAAAEMVSIAITAKPQLSLCLAAGNTPTGMYHELSRLHKMEDLDFSKVTVFYLDEYAGLSADHPECFRTYLERELFEHVNLPETNIHPPDSRYEETIRSHGGIDLLICGIGKNGHIAFNEPGSPMDSRTRIVDLAESTVHGLHGKFKPAEVPRRAITMGLATILESREIILLANGAEKAGILARALWGPVTPDVPASVLQRHANVTVLSDLAIGSV